MHTKKVPSLISRDRQGLGHSVRERMGREQPQHKPAETGDFTIGQLVLHLDYAEECVLGALQILSMSRACSCLLLYLGYIK